MEFTFRSALQKTSITDTIIEVNFPKFSCYIDDLISVTLEEPNPPKCERYTLHFYSKNGMGYGVIKDKHIANAKEALLFLWHKLGIMDAQDAKIRAEKHIHEVQLATDDLAIKKIYPIAYLGGYPSNPNSKKNHITFYEEGIVIDFNEPLKLPYTSITKVYKKNQKEIRKIISSHNNYLNSNHTLANYSIHTEMQSFMIIECHDFELVFSEHDELMKAIYQNVVKYKDDHVTNQNIQSDLDTIKILLYLF